MQQLKVYTDEVLDEESEKNAEFARVRESVEAFRDSMRGWREVSAFPLINIEQEG